jgi:very-short-patch-repair endonuclease
VAWQLIADLSPKEWLVKYMVSWNDENSLEMGMGEKLSEKNAESAVVQKLSIRFLEYLSALAREIGSAPRREMSREEVLIVFDESLRSNRYVTYGPSDSRNDWLSVAKVPKPDSAVLPEGIKVYVDEESVADPHGTPALDSNRIQRHCEDIEREIREENRDNHYRQQDMEIPLASAETATDDTELRERIKHEVEEFIALAEHSLELWSNTIWKQWCEEVMPVFDARKLYDQLYELYLSYDRERDSKEVVWGNGILQYEGEDGVNSSKAWGGSSNHVKVAYPMITTKMNVQINQNNGAITLIPDEVSKLGLQTIEGIGLSGINELENLQQRIRSGEDSIDVWDDDSRKLMEQHIVAPLGVDAKVIDRSETQLSRGIPVISDESVLMLRMRPKHEEQFYAELSKQIGDENFMPEALESLIVDSDMLQKASESLTIPMQDNEQTSSDILGDADTRGNRILMPLPSNDEQRRIAAQIAGSVGVTVQGPPGTGKTHTIANLVSHLLSQGSRVLVTAEKDQALRVLQDKIPEEIRDLTMAVVGSSPASMEHLKDSAQRMQDALSRIDPEAEIERVHQLEHNIDELQDQQRHYDNELQRILASEQSEFALPEGSKRAGDVAKWISDNKGLDVIPDDITSDSPFPMTIQEFNEFTHLCQEISPEEAAASVFDIRLAGRFPDGAYMDRMFSDFASLQTSVKALDEDGLNLEAVDNLDDKQISDLSAAIVQGLRTAEAVDTDIKRSLFDSGTYSETDLLWLRERNSDISKRSQLAVDLDRQLVGHTVETPQGPEQVLLGFLDQWKQRLIAGKKLGLFTSKSLREFAVGVRFDGYEPVSAEQLDIVRDAIRIRSLWQITSHEALDVYGRFGIELDDLDKTTGFLRLRSTAQEIENICAWCLDGRKQLDESLQPYVSIEHPSFSLGTLKQAWQLLSGVGDRKREREVSQKLASLMQLCDEAIDADPGNPIWIEFRQALVAHSSASWNATFHKLTGLLNIHSRCIRRDELGKKLDTAGAPLWRTRMVNDRGNDNTYASLDTLQESWLIAQAKTWLKQLHHGPSADSLMQESTRVTAQIQKETVEVIRMSALIHLKATTRDTERRALSGWLQAIKKVGKGTGKNAPRFQAQAQQLLPTAMGAVPVWIMPIYRVLENFVPGQTRPFDVVIIDESSQCDLLTVGVLALAKKAIIVGDDKQTSPNLVGVNTNHIFELQNRYLSELPDKTLFTHDTSLYSLADRAYKNTILLREHYRCVPEIIEYSNRFYNGQIQPLRERKHPEIGSPLKAVRLEHAVSRKVGSHRVNEEEAQALVNQVVECSKDFRYDDLTFGVVTMMSGSQGKIIESKLIERLGNQELEHRRIRVGNPPDFQGDERDVMFMSMVTDETRYAASSTLWQQWANVAVSRARDQLWVFYSMDFAALNPSDVRRSIIEYVDGFQYQEEPGDLYQLTESKFERDVLRDLLQRGYNVKPQYRVGNFRIDFVVTIAPGYRLAIECDGDTFHGPAQIKDDVRRQRVLERLGWNFWRIRASTYYLDCERAIQPLWQRLEDLRLQAGV